MVVGHDDDVDLKSERECDEGKVVVRQLQLQICIHQCGLVAAGGGVLDLRYEIEGSASGGGSDVTVVATKVWHGHGDGGVVIALAVWLVMVVWL